MHQCKWKSQSDVVIEVYQKETFHFLHQRILDYHNLVLKATYNGHFLRFILIKVTSEMRISSQMIYPIAVSSGFRWKFVLVLKTISSFLLALMYSNFQTVLSFCFSSNPTFTLLVFLKNKILHTFPSLTNHYYGRFEKAELNSFYLYFYICIHISINRIGVVISYTSICPPFLFVHINCIMKRIKLSMGCLIKIIMISVLFANL